MTTGRESYSSFASRALVLPEFETEPSSCRVFRVPYAPVMPGSLKGFFVDSGGIANINPVAAATEEIFDDGEGGVRLRVDPSAVVAEIDYERGRIVPCSGAAQYSDALVAKYADALVAMWDYRPQGGEA